MKKKLHRIGNSKEPTINQLLKMGENLCTVYGVYSNVSATAKAFSGRDYAVAKFRVYVEDITKATEEFDKWPELLIRYRKLMKGKKDGS